MTISEWLLMRLPKRLAFKYSKYVAKRENQCLSIALRNFYTKRAEVTVGLYSYGGCFCPDFNTGGKVHVGRYCSIAENVHYFGANHPVKYISCSAYFYNKNFGLRVRDVDRSELYIGNDVWIGYGVIILAKCKYIGNGAIIGAGSVVTHDVPPYTIVAGNPARIIKHRFNENEVALIESSCWWNDSPNELIKYYSYFDDIERVVSQIKGGNNAEI